MEPFEEDKITDAAWAFLRGNTTATIKFGEHTNDVSYVICPSGELVIPAMVAMLQPCDIIMYVPDYSEDCMEIHVSLHKFDDSGKGGLLSDRWNVYHGDSPDVQWALVDIDAARFHEMFIDGEGLCRENPLAEFENSICKQINENTEYIRGLCLSKTNVDVTDPVVVGVDPLGIDVRAPFGIVRIIADSAFTSAHDLLAFATP
ncbi:MAG: hypothetical protein H8E86_08730 [Planctomycetes bacterium]|nr:hypothetical protein [Planctomycetota bacterium]